MIISIFFLNDTAPTEISTLPLHAALPIWPPPAGGVILPPDPAASDAPMIATLRRQGCVMVGKTNLHEFAYGVTSVNPHYGAVLNPHDPTRVAGGSSGGSAVAVPAGKCDRAIGP